MTANPATSLGSGPVRSGLATAPSFKPGIHHGLTLDEYLEIPAISASMIADLDEQCPAFARWMRDTRTGQERSWTVQRKGSALHARLLEPGLWASRYVEVQGCVALLKSGARAGQACGSGTGRLYKDGFYCGKHEIPDAPLDPRIPIDLDALREVGSMEQAVRAVAGPLIDSATYTELTLCWADEETGLPMKARLDLLTPTGIWDLKALLDVAPQRWGQIMVNAGLHYQAVQYREGAKACGIGDLPFGWIAVRNTEPYLAVVHPPLDEASLDTAKFLWRDRVLDLAQCEKDRRWPGYEPMEHSSLPQWYLTVFSAGA